MHLRGHLSNSIKLEHDSRLARHFASLLRNAFASTVNLQNGITASRWMKKSIVHIFSLFVNCCLNTALTPTMCLERKTTSPILCMRYIGSTSRMLLRIRSDSYWKMAAIRFWRLTASLFGNCRTSIYGLMFCMDMPGRKNTY